MAGSQELPGSFGEEPHSDPEFTRITYDPGPQDVTTPAGKVRQHLKDLVDGAQEITLFGVGPDFVWSDGSTIGDSAGGAIGHWIFYDAQNCGGHGRWVRGTDGAQVCVTSAGILFHELGHIFLNHPVGSTDEDERAAVGFENDLRTAEGKVPRDPDHWFQSHCGCPDDCCIVASVATGSPFSAEVHALRRVRDRILRRTSFGLHFFDVLLTEYYSFSVAISRILVTKPAVREAVAESLVRPLVSALNVTQYYVRHPHDGGGLGEMIGAERERVFTGASRWGNAIEVLQPIAEGHPVLPWIARFDPGIAEVMEILRQHLPKSPHVRWGILELLQIYARFWASFDEREPPRVAGGRLRRALREWIVAVPLEYICSRMQPEDWTQDLPELAKTVFVEPSTRRELGERLAAVLGHRMDKTLREGLARDGYLG
jgi:hypothetical protein